MFLQRSINNNTLHISTTYKYVWHVAVVNMLKQKKELAVYVIYRNV